MMTATRLVLLLAGFFFTPAAAWGGQGKLPIQPAQVTDATGDGAGKVRDILKNHCYRCHGQDGANEGGFNYVTDLRRLVERRKVLPGDPGKSRCSSGCSTKTIRCRRLRKRAAES